MYVCTCNALTDKQIDAACKSGVTSWSEVYAFHGCKPQCGKCIPEVCERLNGDTDNSVATGLFGNAALAEG